MWLFLITANLQRWRRTLLCWQQMAFDWKGRTTEEDGAVRDGGTGKPQMEQM